MDRTALIEGMMRWGKNLAQASPALLDAAVAEQPWFSAQAIRTSISALLPWLQEATLHDFLQNRPSTLQARRVGIIAAGNLPLVGFHDVLMALLAGHEVLLKPARQDRVLMEWAIGALQAASPALGARVRLVAAVEGADALIATGSDNSGRYFRAQFGNIPHLIRGHRLSAAVLTRDTPAEAWQGLCRDILLYNGLGCRSVSQLLLEKGSDLSAFRAAMQALPSFDLHPLFLEKIREESAAATISGIPYEMAGPLCCLRSDSIGPLPMGWLRLIEWEDPAQLEALLTDAQPLLQCVAGRDTPFGRTQFPALHDFADGKDTYDWLIRLAA